MSLNSMCLFADSSFFDVFSYKLLRGDTETALDSRDKCVITQGLATSLFGDSDPIGKVICIRNDTPRITMVKDIMSSHYQKERNLSKIVMMFTIIAIIISTLGLLAMSTYFTRQRCMEVGVRRVFGSTIGQILSRLLWTFIRPMIISFIIATLTVLWQALLTACSNPTESVKTL